MDEIEGVEFFLAGIKDNEIMVKHPVSNEIFDDVFFYIYKSISTEDDILEKEIIDKLNYLVKKHNLSIVNLSRLLKTTTDEIKRVLYSKDSISVSKALAFHLSTFILSLDIE